MTGAGKLDTARAGGWDLKEKYCLVCSEMVFDEKLLKQAAKQKYELKGFQYWMAAHILPGEESTLYEYMKGERPTPDLLAELKKAEDSDATIINMYQKYVVVWRFEIFEKGWASTATSILGSVALVAGCILFPAGAVVWGAVAATTAVVSLTLAISTEEVPDWVPAWALKPGASVGLGIHRTGEADVYQEVFITPEETLSTTFNFDSGKKDFCTIMLN
jgi:hypothetical protein